MKKVISILLTALMLCVFTAACGSGSQDRQDDKSKSGQPETVKLHVAYMPNMGSCSLLITAKDKGFFNEMGLDVELTEFGRGPEEIAAMASGSIDIAQIGHGAHALCIEGKAKIFSLDCISMADMIMANKDKGINSIADLKGKTIAVTGGSSSELILMLALAEAGLSKNDVELVEMDSNGMVTAMVNGQVDACAVWMPNNLTIEKGLGDKAIVLRDNRDYLDKATFPSSMITTDKFASEHHDILVRFERALLKAADYRVANLEEVCKMVATQCDADVKLMLDSKDESEWLTSKFIADGIKDGTIKQYYESQQQTFIDEGRIEKPVPVEDYVLLDIMEEAVDANAKE